MQLSERCHYVKDLESELPGCIERAGSSRDYALLNNISRTDLQGAILRVLAGDADQ